MRRYVPLLLILVALACGGDETSRPPLPEPPSLVSLTMLAGSVLADTVIIGVAAERADRAVLLVDATEAVADSTEPFVLVWDSQTVANGPHELTVLAVNEAGFADTTLNVVVDNLGGGVVVTVSPEEVSLESEESAQFAATVFGAEDHAVIWSLWRDGNPVSGGVQTFGAVDSTGLYTAPAVIPAEGQIDVRATSVEDRGAGGLAKVTLTQGFVVAITMAPAEVILGRTYQLEAEVLAADSTGVTWSVDEGPAHGAIDQDGLYTTPGELPDPAVVTFRATSHVDSTVSDSLTASMISPILVTVTPDTTTLSEGGLLQFAASLEDSETQRVTWSIVEGRRAGTINSITGLYIAPDKLPSTPVATIRARSLDDSRFSGTATVNLVEGPPAGEAALFGEMYAATVDAANLSEQITGIVGTALDLARSLSGDPNATTGTLYTEEEIWTFADDQPELLVVESGNGPDWSIRFTAASGGMTPPITNDYAPGLSFYGHLDCTITVEEHELHLTNLSWVPASAKPGEVGWVTQFTRSLEGSFPEDGRGLWTVSFIHEGVSELDAEGDYEFDHRLSGQVDTPDDLSVALDESLFVSRACNCSGQVGHDYQRRAGDLTVESGDDTYVWNGMNIATTYEANEPSDVEAWRGVGAVTKNGAAYGEITLSLPLPLGLDDDPHPTLEFAHGHRLILLIPPMDDAPWTVPNPFEKR